MGYQWDPKKAASNLRNHGIDFADAVGVFEDDWALTLEEQEVRGEQRFVSVGTDLLGRVIVVVYTYRDDDIRIISARKALKVNEEFMKTKEYNFANAKRGAVVETPPNKTRITIRVDTDTLNWFRERVHKAGGGNYQTLMNEALREYIQHRDANLERILRRVIQEELQAGTTRTPARRIARSSRLLRPAFIKE